MNRPLHFYTLTGNLLAERTLEFPTWSPGRTQRAVRESFQVGGKGINVAKMLARLGAPHTALCFTGGAPGAECEAWLRARGFAFHAFPTDAPTRTGAVVRGAAQAETTFLGCDAVPSASAVQACADFLDAQPDGRLLAVCGSLPGWTTDAFAPLRAALARWSRRGPLAADTYGPPLAWFAAQSVALIKINADEFAAFAGRADDDMHRALGEARGRFPVQRWIVTDGPGDVWFCEANAAPARLSPPPVVEVSATGSGDVLLACVLDALFRRGLPFRDAVATALPFASANAAHPGIAEFPLPV
jgi:1-phosphofructokinase